MRLHFGHLISLLFGAACCGIEPRLAIPFALAVWIDNIHTFVHSFVRSFIRSSLALQRASQPDRQPRGRSVCRSVARSLGQSVSQEGRCTFLVFRSLRFSDLNPFLAPDPKWSALSPWYRTVVYCEAELIFSTSSRNDACRQLTRSLLEIRKLFESRNSRRKICFSAAVLASLTRLKIKLMRRDAALLGSETIGTMYNDSASIPKS